MTKKFIFLLLLMFTGLQIMQAQQTYSIKGIVKDAANSEPVSFANVVIWNTIEGTVCILGNRINPSWGRIVRNSWYVVWSADVCGCLLYYKTPSG